MQTIAIRINAIANRIERLKPTKSSLFIQDNVNKEKKFIGHLQGTNDFVFTSFGSLDLINRVIQDHKIEYLNINKS